VAILGAGVDDGERVALTSAQLRRLVLLLVAVVLFLVVVGRALRVESPTPRFAAPGSAAATAFQQAGAGESAEDAAKLERGAKILLGIDRMYTGDFNALNKSLGEPVLLRTRDTDLRVTPARATAGTAACAAGSLVTVELLVERVSGSAGLTPNNFALLAADGSAAAPIQGCSTGFAEAAAQRTLVFAVEQPDRLVVGTDPADPAAGWQLS